MKINGGNTTMAGIWRQKGEILAVGKSRQLPQVVRVFPVKREPGASPAQGSALRGLWSMTEYQGSDKRWLLNP